MYTVIHHNIITLNYVGIYGLWKPVKTPVKHVWLYIICIACNIILYYTGYKIFSAVMPIRLLTRTVNLKTYSFEV